MLYTKYESSRPCSFRQEDFWKLHFENLFFDPVTYNEWFQRRRCLSKKVYARRTTDDGQRPVTIAHPDPEHFVLRWAKNTKVITPKIRQDRVTVLMHCTSSQWGQSTYSFLWIALVVQSYFPDKVQNVKIKMGNNSKIRQGRVTVLMHCTSSQRDLSTYKVFCW